MEHATAIAIGFAGLFGLGAIHVLGLRLIIIGTPGPKERPYQTLYMTWSGLVVLHSLEIIAASLFVHYCMTLDWMGSLEADGGVAWYDLFYLTGIAFTTLGMSEIETEGPIRLVIMLLSLGGFMVLTWSATFFYSVWEELWTE